MTISKTNKSSCNPELRPFINVYKSQVSRPVSVSFDACSRVLKKTARLCKKLVSHRMPGRDDKAYLVSLKPLPLTLVSFIWSEGRSRTWNMMDGFMDG